jgi:hypothetical protein
VSATRFPTGSPTFALRPITAPFSHIEYPNVSPAGSYVSEDYDSEPQDSIAMAYSNLRSREHSYSERQPAYETTALGFQYPEPQRPHSYQTSSERSSKESHTFNQVTQQMERTDTVRPQVRRRVRGDSSSSVASMWSSIAVVGDPNYHKDMFYEDKSSKLLFVLYVAVANTMRFSVSGGTRAHGSPTQPDDHFHPHSAPASYSYDYALEANTDQQLGSADVVSQGNLPSSPAVGMDLDPPIMIPPAPRPGELDLQDPDHPFTYQGAHWDVSNGDFSVASTDVDAVSLHSQDRPSSRDSGRPTSANRHGRKATPEQRKLSGEGRKKTVMACHFCRRKSLVSDQMSSAHSLVSSAYIVF